MTQWLAGMKITADRLNDFTPVLVTDVPTAATNFTVSSFSARKAGGVTEWAVTTTYSGSTITAGSTGNITDTTVMTLPSSILPLREEYADFEVSGATAGSVRFNTDGTCVIVALYPTATIASGQTVKFGAAFAAG